MQTLDWVVMKIAKVLFAPGKSAFFSDDQRAVKHGAPHDGFAYKGEPITPGFRSIREPGESISVLLLLEDGQIAVGDCAAVAYSGAGGRDPIFRAEVYLPLLKEAVRPLLEQTDIGSFGEMADRFERMTFAGKRLHTALRYGLSQALLDARAKEQAKLKCEVLSEEFGLPLSAERIPVLAQSGDNRYEHVDKMILKEVDVLPHGLINSIDNKLGRRGEKLKEYVSWIVKRIKHLRPNGRYSPTLHIDVYGTIGDLFDSDANRISDYLATLEEDADGLELFIEGPVDMEQKALQIETLARIRGRLRSLGSRVKIVADEWCNTLEDIKDFVDARACDMVQIKTPDLGGIQNTVEAIRYAKDNAVGAYQGGTCNETDVSARCCVHVALAARPDRMLAKPGMGFDEGFAIVNNEMERIITILCSRKT